MRIEDFYVDYSKISHAIEFYKGLGYKYIETPWIVSGEAKAITFGGEKEKTPLGILVGSAEQGFLELMLQGKLSRRTPYVSAGPCFRFDDNGKSQDHLPYFFKVELFYLCDEVLGEDAINWSNLMVNDAKRYLGGWSVKTEDGVDLLLGGVEIGSYGIRTYSNFTWAYGTGLAEPRHSYAKWGIF